MKEEANLRTYLSISPNKFGIYLFDTKSFTYLYESEIEIENNFTSKDMDNLTRFLEDNVFNIEKLIGKFLNNIILIIKSKKILETIIGIKKKNYEEKISKNFLDTMIIDVKDLFKENYQNEKVLHMIIKRYLVDGKLYFSLNNNLRCKDLCMEIQFSFISTKFISDISKVLEKYQIKIIECIDHEYIEVFFKHEDMKICEMAYKIENGHNENEVKIIPKSTKNIGFFEKFFQLFS